MLKLSNKKVPLIFLHLLFTSLIIILLAQGDILESDTEENYLNKLYQHINMDRIILWVPNFSEGRNKKIIEEISKEALKVNGVFLLDVSTGYSTHRTVYTFAGSPESVIEAALRASAAALIHIDMTKHHGEHPRLGALDVSPFIPLKGVTFEECAEYAKKFAEKLATSLKVPVYLYGKCASSESRSTVPQIRVGEYEGLEQKLKDPAWAPDYGPIDFIPSWGASIVGCRDFLIAYNINTLSTKEQAHAIALNIRESGRGPEQPGRLKHLQAIGWYLDEDKMAQISTNIIDYHATPICAVFEEANKDAQEMKIAIVGSEIIGLIPKQALLDCAQYYIEKEDLLVLEEENKMKLAIDRLGLNTVKPFNRNNQIIEYKLRDKMTEPTLGELKIKDFVGTVSSRTPVPGGGSVSALVASLGTALSSMVAQFSSGTKKYEDNNAMIKKILPPLYDAQFKFIDFMDQDSRAFQKVLDVNKKSYANADEKAQEHEAALKEAANVPLDLARFITSLWPYLNKMAPIANPQVISDLQVSIRLLHAATYGARYNVLINLKGFKDNVEYQDKIKSEIDEITFQADQQLANMTKDLAL